MAWSGRRRSVRLPSGEPEGDTGNALPGEPGALVRRDGVWPRGVGHGEVEAREEAVGLPSVRRQPTVARAPTMNRDTGWLFKIDLAFRLVVIAVVVLSLIVRACAD